MPLVALRSHHQRGGRTEGDETHASFCLRNWVEAPGDQVWTTIRREIWLSVVSVAIQETHRDGKNEANRKKKKKTTQKNKKLRGTSDDKVGEIRCVYI